MSVIASGGSGLAGIAYDKSGALFVASQDDGTLLRSDSADPSELMEHTNTGGQPADVAVEPVSGRLYVADLAHAAILLPKDDGQLQLVVKEYEGVPFKGPSSLAFSDSGSLYFTDSGPLGETTLQDPTGSVYAITGPPEGQVLRPLALNCLAHPCGITLSPSGSSVYVSEMLTNRVLRFVERPVGVYHMSVFYQFSGRMGPSALTVDKAGNIYVARYDFSEVSDVGIISVLSPEGELLREIETPGAELSGLALSPSGRSIVVSEGSTQTITEFPVDGSE